MANGITKYGFVLKAIAWDLLTRSAGDKMPTFAEYAARYSVGVGTVQSAISTLVSSGAIKLRSRGALGSIIVRLSFDALWETAGGGVVLGSLPIPDDTAKKALASALYKLLGEAGIPVNLSFMRGSENRLRTVSATKSDFAVLSHLGWRMRSEPSKSLRAVATLGKGSYSSGYSLVSCRGPINTVAVDPFCAGLAALTYAECGMIPRSQDNGLREIRLVPCLLTEVPWKLAHGEIDAAILSAFEAQRLSQKLPLQVRELNREASALLEEATTATIVVSSHQKELGKLLLRLIRPEVFSSELSKFASGAVSPLCF
ncbi:MAG: YhfZ family protein [Bacteroidota bacterium]